VSKKIIVCRCEDVTLADIRHAVASGYLDLEEVKRYTGFGTGPCQGKECLRTIALAIADAAGRPAASVRPFTTRPPLVPTELKYFVSPENTPVREGDRDGSDRRERGRGGPETQQER
jgi:bacterioferritin-associated ferredoxin